MIVDADPTDPDVASFVCVGIAEASSSAITTALKAGNTKLGEVESAGLIDRSKPAEHVATLVTMKDGSQYVFDWHKTLNSTNPFLYVASDWSRNRNGIMFNKFHGFS
jgi:hypothetical protein